mgnify:CR=1 FL=1
MQQQLLDSEFADDTAIHFQGNDDNLSQLQVVMEEFCLAFAAKINWHKSLGFWVSQNSLPTSMPSQEFKWVPDGTTTRYLGCQVALHVNAYMLVAPLLVKLRRKLLLWDSVNLLFAGRVLVANQVLLATIWYIASTRCLLDHVFCKCKASFEITFGEEK